MQKQTMITFKVPGEPSLMFDPNSIESAYEVLGSGIVGVQLFLKTGKEYFLPCNTKAEAVDLFEYISSFRRVDTYES